MMENKCNKTPNNKYLDHVYCHSTEGKNYIRANNNATGTVAAGQDVKNKDKDVKENKQLKAMLILHLDLIQEQSDQLMSKDKVLNSLREETESLKAKNLQLEAQVQELQKQLQRQMKRVATGGVEVSTLPPPPLAKIQCKVETETNSAQTTKTDETKYPKEESALKEQLEKGVKLVRKNYRIQEITTKPNGTQKSVGRKSANIIGECNGKLISKIILHRVNTAGMRSPVSTASDSTSELEESSRREADESTKAKGTRTSGATSDARGDNDDDWYEMDDINDEIALAKRMQALPKLSSKIPRGAKPRKSMCKSAATPVKTQPTPSRGGKQMPLMLTHAPELHSDESASCDSAAEIEQHTTCISSPAPSMSPKDTDKHHQENLAPSAHTSSHQHYAKARRCGYISTTQRYCTRAWEDEEFNCDYELMRDDVSTLRTDLLPVLEIPKWTEHEISGSYCTEGTEDLSDDTFLKRHAKLELDEKRRKKWDVQQIREQRRIEKLKRRHCKDELQNAPDQQHMLSFYPPPDAIEMICYVNDLPVQAFGELIPKLSTNSDFTLPWLNSQNTSSVPGVFNFVATLSAVKLSTSSHQAQRQMLNSSFVFMKKRRRQQSSSGAIANTRQRAANAAAAVAAATKTVVDTATSRGEGQSPTLTTNVNSTEATKN